MKAFVLESDDSVSKHLKNQQDKNLSFNRTEVLAIHLNIGDDLIHDSMSPASDK